MTSELIQALERNNATVLRQCLEAASCGSGTWSESELSTVKAYRHRHVEHVKRSSNTHGDVYIHNATLLMLAVLHGNNNLVEHLTKEIEAEGLNETCSAEDTSSTPSDYERVTPLLIACMRGELEMAKNIIKAGGSVNVATTLGDTPLFEACYEGHLSIVTFLIQNGADIDAANEKGVTCLMITAYVGNLDIAKFLVNNAADLRRVDNRGRNVLFYCVAGGHVELLKFFLAHAELTPDANGMTILMEAALNGNMDIVKYLADGNNGIDIDTNAIDQNGRNVLFYCCESGNVDFFQVFDFLFKHGVNVRPSSDDRTLLMLGCLKGNFSVIEFLVKNATTFGININEKDDKGRNCLFYCITGGHLKMLEYLLHEGVRVESSKDGVTILMQAAGKGKIDIALYLVKHCRELRLDVDQTDKDGWNCVFYCIAGGHASLCQTLLTNGAKVLIAADGRTVLMQAAACGHIDIVRFLLDNYYTLGLDVQDKDNDGWNAAFHSVHSGKLEILEFLIKRGSRIEPAFNGETLLMEASGKNKANFVDYLVKHAGRLQINPKACDQDGNNLLFYAASSGNLELFESFLKLGAEVQVDTRGRTVLMQAASGGHIDVCRYLLDNDVILGLDILAKDKEGRNAVFYCIESGNLELLELLINHGLSTITDQTGRNNLMQAALLGDYAIVEYLVSHSLQLNIDIQASDCAGENVLFYSQRSGKKEVIRYLLGSGVYMKTNASGSNVVQESIRAERLDLVKLFVFYGRPDELAELSWDRNYGTLLFQQSVADGDIKSLATLKTFYNPADDMNEEGVTSLMKACQQSDAIMVKYLLSIVNADMCPLDKRGKNALFHATESGNFDIIRLLIEHGAKPVADDRGRTIVMVAAERGNMFIVHYILNVVDGGSKLINATDNEGRNIVHFCALGGDHVMLKVLINQGCHTDLPDVNGVTPLMLAAAKGKTMLVSRLLKEGASINHADTKFRCAIHYCCDVETPSLTCMGMLVYRGADVNARDDQGETALMKVCGRGNVVAAKCLLDRGADPILHDYKGRETIELCPNNNQLLEKVVRHYSVMQPHLQWVLEEFREELICIVDVTRLLPLMQRDHVITSELETTILSQETTRGKMEKLIDTLKLRSDKAFNVLCKSLKRDYKPLAYELEMFAYTRDEEVFA